uniref:NADH:ubiquinone reductase (H(+)-translocating) n=1 Tax=Glossina pallidipes TaxID=7398 RepID=A0A1A9ZHP4_GLOPL
MYSEAIQLNARHTVCIDGSQNLLQRNTRIANKKPLKCNTADNHQVAKYCETALFKTPSKASSLKTFGLIILAAITKNAQILLSSLFPAAIAAPISISALVHSSTLITAGFW